MKLPIITASVFGVILITTDMLSAQPKGIVGVYETVSESEWSIKVDLRVDRMAVITVESWDPGEYDNRSVEEIVATWEPGYNNDILLHYNGITDNLKYYSRLSLKELGQQGAIPGIWQKGTYYPGSEIRNAKLWRISYFPCAEDPPQVLILPEELVDIAAKSGYKQIDEYYDFSKAIDPPYVYGYKPTDKWKSDKFTSAVFWCEKWGSSGREHVSELKYYLLVVSRSDSWSPLRIDDVIEWDWGSFPGGLSLYEDTLATLDQFYHIDGDSAGPAGIKLEDKIISCGGSGIAIDFYKYNGRWLIRMWD